jgi:hypothetical protein
MNKKFLHFISKNPCMLNINGEHIGIIDNITSFEIDIIVNTSHIFVTNNPINNDNNQLPNTYKLDTINTPYSENKYVSVIPFPNNHYDILMLPFCYYQVNDSKIILNENIGKYFISIASDNLSRITIFSGSNIIFNINTPQLTSAKAEIKKDILIINGIIDNDTYYLLIIDTKDFSIIYNDHSHSIENADDYIQTLKKLNTLFHQGVVHKINIENKNIEKYHVYEKHNNSPLPYPLIPKAFLQSIMIGDEKTAKLLLGKDLQSSTLTQLQNYFGQIQSIFLNRHEISNKLNYTIYNSIYKNYNFELQDNKIVDIEEIF